MTEHHDPMDGHGPSPEFVSSPLGRAVIAYANERAKGEANVAATVQAFAAVQTAAQDLVTSAREVARCGVSAREVASE